VGVWLEWRGVLRLNEYPQHIGFYCPACKTLHVFDERWTFDGDYDQPTFTPSLRTSSGHYVAGSQRRPDGKCGICESAKERGVQSICGMCHLNVTKGRVTFHADCTHDMAGQTAAMVAKPDDAQ
jgi:hypothetical protein